MSLSLFDSRIKFGTDMGCISYPKTPMNHETSAPIKFYPYRRLVRVILGNFGLVVRLSAPDIDLTVEGENFEDAWPRFLNIVKEREDSAWLTFDVGPTRPDEISAGLNVPEDEDWSGLLNHFED